MRINSVKTWLGLAVCGPLSGAALAHHETAAVLESPVLVEHTGAYMMLAMVAVGLIFGAGRWILGRQYNRDDG